MPTCADPGCGEDECTVIPTCGDSGCGEAACIVAPTIGDPPRDDVECTVIPACGDSARGTASAPTRRNGALSGLGVVTPDPTGGLSPRSPRAEMPSLISAAGLGDIGTFDASSVVSSSAVCCQTEMSFWKRRGDGIMVLTGRNSSCDRGLSCVRTAKLATTSLIDGGVGGVAGTGPLPKSTGNTGICGVRGVPRLALATAALSGVLGTPSLPDEWFDENDERASRKSSLLFVLFLSSSSPQPGLPPGAPPDDAAAICAARAARASVDAGGSVKLPLALPDAPDESAGDTTRIACTGTVCSMYAGDPCAGSAGT